MAYTEDVNVNLNVLTGTLGGVTAIMGGMSALTSSFGAMGTEAAETFGTLDGLLVTSTALIASFAAKSAEAFGQFEQGMKIVQTVSNQSGAAISDLKDKANEMSVAYRTSIGDITDGLQTLGRAGLNSVNEQLEVLESGLQTAKLEGRNLNGVLEELIQNTAMLGGNLKSDNFGEQTEYINSLLVGTSMTAPITSHDISQTLQYAGGTAAAAGANINSTEGKKKLEDLMGTIAAFAQKGVTGSMAGTALRAFFTKPASQDKSVTAGLEAIGLSAEDLWEDGGESMKSVSDQIRIIQKQMDKLNLSTMDQIEIWGKIVGAKMGQQMMKLDSSTIKDITRDIQSANSAEELATLTLQTYTQKLSEMQQQGDIAFREFGSKAVIFLQPAVELITWILDKLSNPWINTAIFVGVGSLLAHGFRIAYGMIQTVYNQLMNLIHNTIAGIEQINTLAGGSAGGFAQSSAQVDFLNAKLKETDATLQAIQAKSLGVKPGYIMPGSHGAMIASQVDKGVLKAYEENVVQGGVYQRAGFTSMEGKLYSGDYAKKLVAEATQINEQNKGLQEQAYAQNEKNLQQQAIYSKKINEVYDDRIKGIKKDVDYWRKTGIAPQYKYAMEKELNNLTKIAQKGQISTQQKLDAYGRIYDKYEAKTAKLGITPQAWANEEREKATLWKDSTTKGLSTMYPIQSKQAIENAHPVLSDKQIAQLEKEAATTVQTQLQWMKTGQAKKWMKNYNINDDVARYSRERTQELWDREGHAIDKYRKQGWVPVMKSRRIMDTPPNSDLFYQGENSGLNQAYVDAKNKVERQVKDKAAGISGNWATKTQEVTTRRLQAYNNALNKALKPVNSFTSAVGTARQKISIFRNGIENMGPQLTQKAVSAFSGIQAEATSVEQGLAMLMKETNLNATEFQALWENSTILQQRFTALINSTLGEEQVTKEEIGEIVQDIAVRRQEKMEIEGGILKKGLKKGESAISSVVGFMGGPFMAGMMAFTIGMQYIQGKQQAWQKKMQEATEKMTEAMDRQTQAEEKITDKLGENATDLDKQDAILDAYANIYDNLGKNSDKLDENTAELMRATEAYKMRADASTQTNVNDPMFGQGSWGSEISDRFGTFSVWMSEFGGDIIDTLSQSWLQSDRAWYNINNENTDYMAGLFFDQHYERTSGAGYFDSNNVVLTAAQSDDNYPWLKEFSPIFAADIWDLGIEGGLRQAFGGDVNKIIDILQSQTGNADFQGTAFQTQAENINTYFKDAAQQNRLQLSLKNYGEDFTNLGYQTRLFEKASGGKSALSVFQKGAGITKTNKENINAKKGFDALKKESKQDTTRLINYIKSLSIKTGMDEQRVLLATQLQQMQIMQQIANEVVAPNLMSQTAEALNQTAIGYSTHDKTTEAAGGAITAGENARAIAALLQVEMEGKLQEGAKTYAIDEQIKGAESMSASEVYATGREEYDKQQKGQSYDKDWARVGEYYLESYARANGMMWGRTGESLDSYVNSFMNNMDNNNTAFKYGIDTLRNGSNGAIAQAILDQYDLQAAQSNTPSTDSTGGGSDGSGGSSDKDSGTKKERVDLVLCNKKEIPKLNVNLFKKPPNFIVLNKNFKLRDIKINSEDKPKAIMNAIKNGIIETQKRMDPKIIQDSEAVYDPVDATEGTPSGTTKTTT